MPQVCGARYSGLTPLARRLVKLFATFSIHRHAGDFVLGLENLATGELVQAVFVPQPELGESRRLVLERDGQRIELDAVVTGF